MRNLIADLKYAGHILTGNPRFACAAFITLTLGAGATTALSTLVNPMLLRLLPA